MYEFFTAMNSMTMSYILHADFRSWRPAILSRLNERNNVQYRPYNTYKLAIEKVTTCNSMYSKPQVQLYNFPI